MVLTDYDLRVEGRLLNIQDLVDVAIGFSPYEWSDPNNAYEYAQQELIPELTDSIVFLLDYIRYLKNQ